MSANVGGQAVLEGVMMRSPGTWAVTVRRSDGGLARVCRPISSAAARHRWMRLPIIRGVVALGESLVIGFRALSVSATYASIQPGRGGRPGGGGRAHPRPDRVRVRHRHRVRAHHLQGLAGGHHGFSADPLDAPSSWSSRAAIRVSFLIAYLALISLVPDLRRVFQYHAAEHKAINAYEDGAELTPERVQSYSKIHVRCGTAFLLWVMVIAIFVFALVGRPDWPVLIASRIVLLPVIAGLAYEVIRFGGKHPQNPVVRTLLAPGPVAAVAHDARADARPGRGVDPGAARRPRRGGGQRGPLARRGHGVSSRVCREPTPPTRCAS